MKRLALIGANGMLAAMVQKKLPADYLLFGYDLPLFDIRDRHQVQQEMARLRPDVIINCAAYTNVDGCESEEALAAAVNGTGPGHLAEAARDCGATLVHVSTDYVFDGGSACPYTEKDATAPLSAYGHSKLRGEEAIAASGLRRFFVLRTSWLYGPGGKNFVETIVRLAGEREELRIVADQTGSPTYTGDLAAAIFHLLSLTAAPAAQSPNPNLFGLYHFSNEGMCSWHQFAEAIIEEMRGRGLPIKAQRVLPIATEEYPLPARRPANSLLSKEKYRQATGAPVPHWRSSLAEYFASR